MYPVSLQGCARFSDSPPCKGRSAPRSPSPWPACCPDPDCQDLFFLPWGNPFFLCHGGGVGLRGGDWLPYIFALAMLFLQIHLCAAVRAVVITYIHNLSAFWALSKVPAVALPPPMHHLGNIRGWNFLYFIGVPLWIMCVWWLTHDCCNSRFPLYVLIHSRHRPFVLRRSKNHCNRIMVCCKY